MSLVSVKQMMLRGAPAAPEAVADYSPERALRFAVRRAAEHAHGWMIGVLGVGIEVVQFDELLPLLGKEHLYCGVERGGLVGLIALDAETRAALVEFQACGSLSPKEAEARAPTAVDFAFATPFLTALLTELGISSQGTELEGWTAGTNVGAWVQSLDHVDTRLLSAPYRIARITLDLGSGDRQGALVLAIAVPEEKSTDKFAQAPDIGQKLVAAVLQTTTQIEAILHRTRTTSADLERYQVGDVIALGGASLDAVSVEIAQSGHKVGNARLGQTGGMKAIRIEPITKPSLEEIDVDPPNTQKPPERVAFDSSSDGSD